nr:hypothetical protein 8 [Bacillaceae bacterium]
MVENNGSFFVSLKNYIREIDREIMKGDETSEFSIRSLDDLSKYKQRTNGRATEIALNTKQIFSEMLSQLNSAEFKHEVISYSKVTEIIFEYADNELFDMLEMYLQISWDIYVQEGNQVSEQLERKFLKIKEHIILSVKQKSQISNSLSKKYRDFYEKFNEVQNKLGDVERKIMKAHTNHEKMQEDYDKKYNNLTTQFITILGIFSAILMGAFGSLQGFTSMYENANDLPIGKLLTMSSIGGSSVVLILFFLFHGISKLTGHKLSSCNCHLKRKRTNLFTIRKLLSGKSEDDSRCNCSLFEKYPSVVVIHYFLYFLMSTGFVLIYLDQNSGFSSNFNSPFSIVSTVVTFYGFIILSLLLVHILFVTKKKQEKWYKQLIFRKNS